MTSQIFLRIKRNIVQDSYLKKEFDRIAFKAFSKAALKIERRVNELLGRELERDKTLDSILYGDLQVDFGLSPPMAFNAVTTIKNFIIDSLEVSVVRGHGGDYSRIEIDFSPDIEELQQLPIASYTSDGGDVPWLWWLLNKGTTVAVEGYESIHSVVLSDRSRSGRGFMLKTGGMFRVPTQYAGTAYSNFVTKFVDRVTEPIEAIVYEEMVRNFK